MTNTTKLYEDIYNKGSFSFGKNWKNFLESLNDEKIEIAKKSLLDFLGGIENIKGKTFIDVGCGSGLFSLSAYLLGAKEVVSIDIDENSVWCVKYLREKQLNPDNWKIITGSALDKTFIDSLGKYDIVYSWGVLHHTGNMYKAFDNVINLIDEKGVFFLAIYNKFITAKIRWYIKYFYNKTPNSFKFIWVAFHYIYVTLMYLVQGKLIFTEMKNYTGRGMNFHTDVIDWLGGFPYEYMTTKEAIEYFNKFGLKFIKIKEANGPACWEILFQKN